MSLRQALQNARISKTPTITRLSEDTRLKGSLRQAATVSDVGTARKALPVFRTTRRTSVDAFRRIELPVV